MEPAASFKACSQTKERWSGLLVRLDENIVGKIYGWALRSRLRSRTSSIVRACGLQLKVGFYLSGFPCRDCLQGLKYNDGETVFTCPLKLVGYQGLPKVILLVAGSCRSFPQDSSNVFSFMR